MKTLIVTAHPSTQGTTHKIAAAYSSIKKENGSETFLMNLYEEKYQQSFLQFEEMKGVWSGDKTRKEIQKHIAWADEIIFAYPMWWSAMPAVMKNFIDNNFTAGFAFRYDKGRPQGLLKNKSVRIFTTADGPKIMYTIFKPALQIVFNKGIFGFCGMKLMSFDIFTDMGKKKDTYVQKELLARVRARAL